MAGNEDGKKKTFDRQRPSEIFVGDENAWGVFLFVYLFFGTFYSSWGTRPFEHETRDRGFAIGVGGLLVQVLFSVVNFTDISRPCVFMIKIGFATKKKNRASPISTG